MGASIIKGKIDKRRDNSKCRLCDDREKKNNHMRSNCNKLAQVKKSSSKELRFSEFKTQLRSFEDTDKYHQNLNEDNVMKLTNSFSKTNNEVSCFKCNGKGHVAKICPNNFKKNKKWCNYCKRQLCEGVMSL